MQPKQEELFDLNVINTHIPVIPESTLDELERHVEWLDNYYAEWLKENQPKGDS